jgi:hypothetical protein
VTPRPTEIPFDDVDQLLVEVDEAAEKVDHELEVLRPVRQCLRRLLGVVEAAAKIGDVVAQGEEARSSHLFSDEIADQ